MVVTSRSCASPQRRRGCCGRRRRHGGPSRPRPGAGGRSRSRRRGRQGQCRARRDLPASCTGHLAIPSCPAGGATGRRTRSDPEGPGSRRAMDLELADVLAGGLEARDETGCHPVRQLQHRRGVCRRLRREALAGTRADGNLRSSTRVEAKPGHPLDRSEKSDKRRQVVRAHVEKRTGAVGVEEVGVRMPAGLVADEHGRTRRERLADRSVVDQPARRLICRAEEDVRRAAQAGVRASWRRQPTPLLRPRSSRGFLR